MLKQIQRFEAFLERLEGGLLAILVVVMLVLAVYNVFYRNVLVPIQAAEDTTEVVAQPTKPVKDEPTDSAEPKDSDEAAEPTGFGGGFDDDASEGSDGFGGGFDTADIEEAPNTEGADGFGGGFGDETEDEQEQPEAKPQTEPDESDGFGGGFGDESEKSSDGQAAEESANGFGGGFDDGESEGGDDGFGGGFDEGEAAVAEPPAIVAAQPSSLDAEHTGLYDVIDAVKLEWIDVLLRQLVLLVGFLGAMLAARRRKHITIDALSKAVPEKFLPAVEGGTSLLAAVVCVFLAMSGWDLVQISLEYPKELMHWANESTFQMMFPIGFGLLSFHFGVRVMENGAQMLGMEVDIYHEELAIRSEEEE